MLGPFATRPGEVGRDTSVSPLEYADFLRERTANAECKGNEVLAERDPSAAIAALGTVARARGMAKLARSTGLGRESLYKALRSDGNPSFRTVLDVAAALGYRFNVSAAPQRRARSIAVEG
jgi:probable addiction module antidote protein